MVVKVARFSDHKKCLVACVCVFCASEEGRTGVGKVKKEKDRDDAIADSTKKYTSKKSISVSLQNRVLE